MAYLSTLELQFYGAKKCWMLVGYRIYSQCLPRLLECGTQPVETSAVETSEVETSEVEASRVETSAVETSEVETS